VRETAAPRCAGTILLTLMLAAVTGCGGSGGAAAPAATNAASTSTPSTASGSSGLAVDKQILGYAENGAALGPDAGSVTPAQITGATANQFAPTPYKAGSAPKSVVTLASASTSPTTIRQATLELAMLEKLGWHGKMITPGPDFTAQEEQQAMTQAIAQKPDVIIANGIAGAPIGAQLAQAKAAGIFTIGVSVDDSAGPGYQQIVGAGWGLGGAVLASKMIVDESGKPNIHWFNFPQFEFLGSSVGVAFAKDVCPSCAVKQEDIDVARMVSPVSLGQVMSSTIAANPSLTSIAYPGDLSASAIQAAIRTSVNPKVKQYGVTFTSAGAQAIKAGDLSSMIGTPIAWSSVQAVDMALRHAIGRPPLPQDSPALKIGVMAMQKSDVPAQLTDAAIDKWAVGQFNFLAPYEKAWGVSFTNIS
jgi:ABC-type sugar transport system substrate-binding protein